MRCSECGKEYTDKDVERDDRRVTGKFKLAENHLGERFCEQRIINQIDEVVHTADFHRVIEIYNFIEGTCFEYVSDKGD